MDSASALQKKQTFLTKLKTNDATKYLFILFRFLGIIMPVNYKVAYIIFSIISNFVKLIVIPVAFTSSYFIGTEGFQINHFLTSLQADLNASACSLKFLFIIIMRRDLFKIAAILEKLDARIRYPEEMSEVKRIIRFGNRTIFGYMCVFYLYSTVTYLGAIYMGRPPYSLYIPYLNWRTSSWHFAIVSFLEYLLINIGIFQEIANDAYAIIYVELLHSHLNMVIMRVAKIGTDPSSTQDDNLKELIECIRDHKLIIELIKAVGPVISSTVFIQFAVTTISMGPSFINISISNDNSTLFGSVSFVMCLIIEILPICYLVNNLTADAYNLPLAILHINWMDQNKDFRRLCLFFIHRSQKEIVFYAAKLFPISIDTFFAIMKFSFSVYTLLTNMDFGQKFN